MRDGAMTLVDGRTRACTDLGDAGEIPQLCSDLLALAKEAAP